MAGNKRKIPVQSAHRAKRQALAEATQRVFLRNGLAGTTARAIADETGGSVGALYTYFPSTDDNVNEELCRVLSYLEHPSVVGKTIALMKITEAKASDFDADIMKRNNRYGPGILRSMIDTMRDKIYTAVCVTLVNSWSGSTTTSPLLSLHTIPDRVQSNDTTAFLQSPKPSATSRK